MSLQLRGDRPRVNRWELALWGIGIVLIVAAAIAGILSVSYLFSATSDTSIDTANRAAVEVAFTFAPAVLTAGLISLILAIAARAVRGWLPRHADAGLAHAAPNDLVSDPAASTPVMAEIVQPLPTASPISAPADHTPYMRPTSGEAATRD
jgi:hypothetical protein